MVLMKPVDAELDTEADSRTGPTTPRGSAAARSDLPGYELKDVIGRGGMGEVVLARDLRFGRDVAIKRMRGGVEHVESVTRFLREAKIQARLDHPAVVPVHELGEDANGEPYFTMKRVTGVTLASLLEAGTETRQRLLRAFVDVAQAIDLAHSKRIVHRDLKPANIMVGDFGEVFVLDWGLAREVDDVTTSEPVTTEGTSIAGVTAIGSLLGTPGYMPPEQIRDASSVGVAADIYALGAILFEVLTGAPLHPRGDAIASTLEEGIERSPRALYPAHDVPPELDRLCVAAVADSPAARPSARQLATGVQHYLDGDRDLARRRELARAAVTTARAALAEHRDDDAMRAAGRALALDPSSPAAEIVSRLMLEPPDESSPELADRLRDSDAERTRRHARHATWMWLSVLPLIGLAWWNGARDWLVLSAIGVLACVLSVSTLLIARRPERADRDLWPYAVGNAALLALAARISSPFLIAPAGTCLVLMSIVAYPTFIRRARLVIGGILVGGATPLILEAFDLIRPSWGFVNGHLEIHSYAITLHGPSTTVFYVAATYLVFISAGILASSIARTDHAAQRMLLAQRFRLERLIPS